MAAQAGADAARHGALPTQDAVVDPSGRTDPPLMPQTTVARTGSELPPWIDAPEASSHQEMSGERQGVAAAVTSTISSDAAELGLDSKRLGDRWTDTVRVMIDAGSIGALVRELALQAQCVAIDAAAAPMLWRLRVERETLRAASHCDRLQAALAEAVGRPVRVETEAGVAVDSPALREAAERARRLAEAEQAIENDPLVRALMSQYKTARIVPGSVKSL